MNRPARRDPHGTPCAKSPDPTQPMAAGVSYFVSGKVFYPHPQVNPLPSMATAETPHRVSRRGGPDSGPSAGGTDCAVFKAPVFARVVRVCSPGSRVRVPVSRRAGGGRWRWGREGGACTGTRVQVVDTMCLFRLVHLRAARRSPGVERGRCPPCRVLRPSMRARPGRAPPRPRVPAPRPYLPAPRFGAPCKGAPRTCRGPRPGAGRSGAGWRAVPPARGDSGPPRRRGIATAGRPAGYSSGMRSRPTPRNMSSLPSLTVGPRSTGAATWTAIVTV